MFDLGYSELLLVAIVALLVVGPKDLPKLMRAVGQMVAKVRATARHFKSGMDEMVRQAELDEMREKWEAHNAAIMARTAEGETPPAAPDDGPAARQMRGDDDTAKALGSGDPPPVDSPAASADLGEPTAMPPPPATGSTAEPGNVKSDHAAESPNTNSGSDDDRGGR